MSAPVASALYEKLDLACGQRKQEGFCGVDLWAPDADLNIDLLQFPWPFPDDCANEVHIQHFVEHIPHWRPWFRDGIDGFWLFFDEVWRVCRPDATVTVVHPYAPSARANQDPEHTRYINENTWQYLQSAVREAELLDHYPISFDFEVVSVTNSWVRPEKWSDTARSDEAIREAVVLHNNIVADLMVKLRAIKE